MNRNLKFIVFAEDCAFIARCLDVEVASEGDTQEEAISNLQEALGLFFEGQSARLSELPSLEYRLGDVVVHV
jgi:predicted RNase H-like HicB family nuclease